MSVLPVRNELSDAADLATRILSSYRTKLFKMAGREGPVGFDAIESAVRQAVEEETALALSPTHADETWKKVATDLADRLRGINAVIDQNQYSPFPTHAVVGIRQRVWEALEMFTAWDSNGASTEEVMPNEPLPDAWDGGSPRDVTSAPEGQPEVSDLEGASGAAHTAGPAIVEVCLAEGGTVPPLTPYLCTKLKGHTGYHSCAYADWPQEEDEPETEAVGVVVAAPAPSTSGSSTVAESTDSLGAAGRGASGLSEDRPNGTCPICNRDIVIHTREQMRACLWKCVKPLEEEPVDDAGHGESVEDRVERLARRVESIIDVLDLHLTDDTHPRPVQREKLRSEDDEQPIGRYYPDEGHDPKKCAVRGCPRLSDGWFYPADGDGPFRMCTEHLASPKVLENGRSVNDNASVNDVRASGLTLRQEITSGIQGAWINSLGVGVNITHAVQIIDAIWPHIEKALALGASPDWRGIADRLANALELTAKWCETGPPPITKLVLDQYQEATHAAS